MVMEIVPKTFKLPVELKAALDDRFKTYDAKDMELIYKIAEKWGYKTYYNLGAMMAAIQRYEIPGYKKGYPKKGPIHDALQNIKHHRWFDHVSTIHNEGEPVEWDSLVVSPYDFNMENTKELIEFCDSNNLNFHIGRSILGEIYFQGHTIDIVIMSNNVCEMRRTQGKK